MKLPTCSAFLACLCTTLAFVSLLPVAVRAQGPLTPSAGPTPTMKSLDQIEPRTPISSLPYTISASGSYYLTKNLTVASGSGVIIGSDDVTLDLNGFTISSTAGSGGSGIIFSGANDNVTIRNGQISSGVADNGSSFTGPGFDNGISDGGTPGKNVRVTNVSVRGVRYYGINLGSSNNLSSIVEACSVDTAGAFGIQAAGVYNSKATTCGSIAISGATVENSIGSAVRFGDAIVATTVNNSFGHAVGTGNGINAKTVTNSAGSSGDHNSSSGYGIYASSAANSYGSSIRATGLNAETATNCRGSGESTGLSAVAATNCIGSSQAGAGVRASIANGCYGWSSSGRGVDAYYLATGCFGSSTSGDAGLYVVGTASYCSGLRAGGTAIKAVAGIGCTTFGGIVDCPPGNKFLGTP